MHRQSVYLLVIGVAALVALGLVMLFSTGAFAQDAHGDPYYFVKRQAMWLGIGFVVCLIVSNIDYHFWQRTWWVWYVLAAVLLVLCFVPHIGQKINGSRRWITLGFTSVQPSDLAKFSAIVALAWWYARDDSAARKIGHGFVFPGLLSGLLMALIAPEVDMGTTALLGAVTFGVMFIAGARLLLLLPTLLLGLGALGLAIWRMPERMNRFMAFLYPDKYAADAYQQLQGIIAFGSGGTAGLGLGNGRQKTGYLPFAHTDFIFPTIGEELGLQVTLAVVLLYLVIVAAGFIIALRARDRFGLLLGSGLVLMIAIQAAVNIGVTTALLPNKGLPLPLISYGGSNLVFCLFAVGLLINLYRHGTSDREVRALVMQHAVRTGKKKQVRF